MATMSSHIAGDTRPPRLRVLLVSYTLPQLGGLETMARIIAMELSRLGNIEVRIVSPNPGDWEPGLEGVSLYRTPGWRQLLDLYAWADAVFMNHFYLRTALPLFWQRKKPFALSISGYAPLGTLKLAKHGVKRWLMEKLLRRADAVIACNSWCRDLLPVPAAVVPNPFDDERFTLSTPVASREFGLLFAGRINEVKGCDDLIGAYIRMAKAVPAAGLPGLTLAGDGPLRPVLEAKVREAGLTDKVSFRGTLGGDELAREMGRHRILVVPSTYEEPVGIVALEGLASGCVVVGSQGGGLGETIGAFGFTYANGDVEGLFQCIRSASTLTDDERMAMLAGVSQHLDRYRAKAVVRGYLSCLQAILPKSSPFSAAVPRTANL
jgi:glycosyltransferase involved in cell wall biosynthesis